MEHPDAAKMWHKDSNYLIYLSVNNLNDLEKLWKMSQQLGITGSFFEEPDIEDKLTAIALLGPGAAILCKGLPLMLK